MSDHQTKKPAAKKAAPAKKAPAKKAAAPAKEAKPAPAPKSKPPSLADGPYPWMLNRMRATVIKNLADDKHADARKALAGVTTFAELAEAAKPFGFKDTGPALVAFCDQLAAEGVTVRGGRQPAHE